MKKQCPNYLSEVLQIVILHVTTDSNFQLGSGLQKLKCPFQKTNNGQYALSYIGPIFRNKTPGTLKHSNNLNIFKHNLKTIF